MGLWLELIIFTFSLGGLILSSNYFLNGARQIGLVVGISPFIIGSFIIAFGTSLPEAFIGLFAAFTGAVDVPVGHAVGSNIVNILFLLGITAILARKIVVTKNLIDIELPVLVAVTALFLMVIHDGSVVLLEGIILLAVFLFYLFYLFGEEDKRTPIQETEEQISGAFSVLKNFFIVIIGAVALAVFSYFTIESIREVATIFGVSEGLIAVSIVAFGTSLPELVVSINAVVRKEIEIVIGNIIGSKYI